MAEKKKGKKRKEEYVPPGEEVLDKPTKEEYNVAKWMRKNVPIKKTKFLNHNVEYFTGKRAVDALMESEFATGDDALFQSRKDVVNYLHDMLLHKFFHRARKVPVSEHELKSKGRKERKTDESKDHPAVESKEKGDRGTDAESSVVEGKPEGQQQEKEKRKMKIRLEMHNNQHFADCLDAYVWIYDPIPFYYWIIGTLLVLGAIGVCLFPLWPPSVRLGVYYLSIAAAGFLVFIIVLAVIRLILFCLIWMLSFGKHHLWILPNLTEDVGFFASFWPLYQYEYKGSDKSKTKKKKKSKDSDAEDEGDSKAEESIPSGKSLEKEDSKDNSGDDDTAIDQPLATTEGGSRAEPVNQSESESESSQRSSTGKDFEMVDQDDIDQDS